MSDNARFLQILATLILFFGCGCVAYADRYNWRDLANAGNIVIGVGAGILTGQKASEVTNRDHGSITVNPTEQ